MNSLTELLGFPITPDESPVRKQEWKEIQKSIRSFFVELHMMRDRQWLKRHVTTHPLSGGVDRKAPIE